MLSGRKGWEYLCSYNHHPLVRQIVGLLRRLHTVCQSGSVSDTGQTSNYLADVKRTGEKLDTRECTRVCWEDIALVDLRLEENHLCKFEPHVIVFEMYLNLVLDTDYTEVQSGRTEGIFVDAGLHLLPISPSLQTGKNI